MSTDRSAVRALALGLESMISRTGDLVLGPLLASRNRPGVTLLTFHSITRSPRFKIDLTPGALERVVRGIRRAGAAIVSLDAAVAGLAAGTRSDRHQVVLTFDDGYQDFLTEAVPILARLEAPAVVSVVPAYVESRKAFEFATGGGRKSMSWDELAELHEYHQDLVTIANHSWAHRDYSQMSLEAVRRDALDAQEAFEAHLGRRPRYFTYPYGFARSRTDEALLDIFDALLTGRWGVNTEPGDARLLRRVPLFGHDRERTVALKSRGCPTTYGWLRRAARNGGGRPRLGG